MLKSFITLVILLRRSVAVVALCSLDICLLSQSSILFLTSSSGINWMHKVSAMCYLETDLSHVTIE